MPDASKPPAACGWAVAGGILLFVAYLFWNSLYYFPYIVDDMFISLRYADNLVQGKGLVYNPGERVEGYSNFSWVLLQALCLKLGLPVIACIKWVGVCSGVGCALGTCLLARRLFRGQTLGNTKVVVAVGFLCLNTSLAVWTQAGLETAFLAMLLVGSAWRFEFELQADRAIPISALMFGLAWLTRPEVPIYCLYFLGRRWASRRPWSRSETA